MNPAALLINTSSVSAGLSIKQHLESKPLQATHSTTHGPHHVSHHQHAPNASRCKSGHLTPTHSPATATTAAVTGPTCGCLLHAASLHRSTLADRPCPPNCTITPTGKPPAPCAEHGVRPSSPPSAVCSSRGSRPLPACLACELYCCPSNHRPRLCARPASSQSLLSLY